MARRKGKVKPVRVRIKKVALDDKDKRIFVYLGTPKRTIPVVIGFFEGQAIVSGMRGARFPRPMTYDLMLNALGDVGWTMEKLIVSHLEDQTCYGELHLVSGKRRKVVDCRPSDGMALAVRAKAPIYVAEEVLAEACIPEGAAEVKGDPVPPAKAKARRTRKKRKKE